MTPEIFHTIDVLEGHPWQTLDDGWYWVDQNDNPHGPHESEAAARESMLGGQS